MGQKVNPHGFRVGVVKDWDANWYADKKDFAKLIKEDNVVRTFIEKKYKDALISRVAIERAQGDSKLTINIFTGRPGIVIGQKGAGIDQLRKELEKLVDGKQITINIKEVKNLDSDAEIVAQTIATQIEKRILVKRAIKSNLQRVMKANGVLGCRIMVKGRINGAEMARTEQFSQGSVPLHTIRANIDYGCASAHTTYGVLGVKVWIYKGDILKSNKTTPAKRGGEQ